MYLKSLTIRGFKSFASSTTLNFEPGITAVVGPNGSGKSNVVDAIAWVMGEQGAKTLRGGKMEDVIFSGSKGRAPLGRAEVLLTIDNTDGALPIDYTEVTISRTMFRNGGSEYAINGTACRLLDIQELLSDSGIGREMHVIVGQNRLREILLGTPEQHRGYIEEAAGVLKHRKRKEKALRKLAAMDANLTRLEDLTNELRRQLKPLGRQAEVARRANVIQSDVRDARLRLLADDLTKLREALDAEIADETALRERRREVESELTAAKAREAILDEEITRANPQVEKASDTFYQLGSLQERLRSTLALARERVRLGQDQEEEVATGRDPEEIDREVTELRVSLDELSASVTNARATLTAAINERVSAEAALSAEDARLQNAARTVADRREGIARLAGQVAAANSRVETRTSEIDRLAARLATAREQAAAATAEFAVIEGQVAGLDEGEVNLDDSYEAAQTALTNAEARLTTARTSEVEAERERTAAAARLEALEQGMSRRDGGAAILAASQSMSGILGSVAALMQIESGWEVAIATALGNVADAIAVSSPAAAQQAVQMLHRDEAGRATLVVVGQTTQSSEPWPQLGPNARYAIDLITCDDHLRTTLAGILAKVVVVPSASEAIALTSSDANLTAVTRDGDLYSHGIVQGGTHGSQTLIELQAAVDQARQRLEVAAHELDRAKFSVATALQAQADAKTVVAHALDRLHESDANMAAIAEQLGSLQSAIRSATGEADRLSAAMDSAVKAREDDLRVVNELQARLNAAQQESVSDEVLDESARETLASVLETVRQVELDARLQLRTGEERLSALELQIQQLEHAATVERTTRARAIELREQRRRQAKIAAAVVVASESALAVLGTSIEQAQRERERAATTKTEQEAEIRTVRDRIRELTADLEVLTDTVHRDEVARAEQRLRIETLENKSIEEYGVSPDDLLSEYGPSVLVPPSPPAPGDEEVDEDPQPYPYVRSQQESRLATAERSLALLGKVNPLALEEFSALEERHKFLGEQLEDLRRSRGDLLTVIKDVDERVQTVFAQAFADTEKEFKKVFSALFPDGEARMRLTDPDDLLNSGVEIEARPPGKNFRRLSLLSGGEQSLTAVAFLVALFKARPSPFYILDEVEAALDEVNMLRLLGILADLKASSQLIIITHQKHTMEIADALYGVSMRGDGVTHVISQRIVREEQVDETDFAAAP
ncbi:MAG: chromosome segregation protein SMC [Actinomycetales bacterium]|nr:chromosome segregation protein SMC [Actinomycetales bacterium]